MNVAAPASPPHLTLCAVPHPRGLLAAQHPVTLPSLNIDEPQTFSQLDHAGFPTSSQNDSQFQRLFGGPLASSQPAGQASEFSLPESVTRLANALPFLLASGLPPLSGDPHAALLPDAGYAGAAAAPGSDGGDGDQP